MIINEHRVAGTDLVQLQGCGNICQQVSVGQRLVSGGETARGEIGEGAEVQLFSRRHDRIFGPGAVSQLGRPIDVRRAATGVVHFYRDDVAPLLEHGIVDYDRIAPGSGACIRGGVLIIAHRALSHEIAPCLATIDIDDAAVVDVGRQFKHIVGRRSLGELERLAEIIRRPLIAGIAAIVECCVVVARAVDAYLAIAERRLPRRPTGGGVSHSNPVLAVDSSFVVVIPSVGEANKR